MALQPIPSFQQLNQAATIPPIHRPVIRRRTVAPLSIRPGARNDSRQARERQRLLLEMLPLVKRVAFKIREHLPAHVELDDLVGDGVLGLVDAVAKFDASKQVKLESYACHRIRGGILDGLRGADPASRDLRRKNRNIQKMYREMEIKVGRPVTDEEMATAMGLTLKQWHHTLNEVQGVGFDCGARTLSAGPTSRPAHQKIEPSLLADASADPFDLCYRREQREILGRALNHMRERDRQIISLYYEKELTMKQIADRLHVDESRISQLHSAALVRLKSNVNSLLHPRTSTAALPPLAKAAGAGAS